jgi:hypothetical protein
MIKRIIAISVLSGAMLVTAVNAIAPAMAAKDSCNSEGCNGDYTCINPDQPPGAKGCPNDPQGG